MQIDSNFRKCNYILRKNRELFWDRVVIWYMPLVFILSVVINTNFFVDVSTTNSRLSFLTKEQKISKTTAKSPCSWSQFANAETPSLVSRKPVKFLVSPLKNSHSETNVVPEVPSFKLLKNCWIHSLLSITQLTITYFNSICHWLIFFGNTV